MPQSYSTAQRAAIQQYAVFAKVKESVAAKALKAADWDINVALNAHYTKGHEAPKPSQASNINAVFDKFRDDSNNPDGMGVEGTMSFLQAIGVTLEEPASVAIHHLAGAESMGELERAKFVSGWDARSAGTIESMTKAAGDMRRELKSDKEYFKGVYKHAYLLARAPGQKSAQTETALELWRLMLGHGDGALNWNTSDVQWLDLWIAFIETKGPKVVSRDLWNQTEAFARKSLHDDTLSFWSEESSWPTVIDEFVGHIKANGKKSSDKDTVMGDE